MHRFLSRSNESADMTRRGGTRLWRVGGPRKSTVWYVEEAGGTRLRVARAGRMISLLQ